MTPFGTGQSLVVRAAPFDAVIESSDLVKINVESLEAQLLVSGWQQLRSPRPLIMVEIYDRNDGLRALKLRLDDLQPPHTHAPRLPGARRTRRVGTQTTAQKFQT